MRLTRPRNLQRPRMITMSPYPPSWRTPSRPERSRGTWLAVFVLVATATWAGCLDTPTDERATFEVAGLRARTAATYEVTWDNGQEFLLSLELRPAQVPGAMTTPTEGYEVRMSRSPPLAAEPGSQDALLAPFGTRLPAKFGLDECLAPLWGVARLNANLVADYDTFPTWLPPVFYAAGRTFEQAPDFSYAPETGGTLDLSKAFEIVGRSWRYTITYAAEATLYARTVPDAGLGVTYDPRQWVMHYDGDAALPTLVRAYGPEGTGTLRLRTWDTAGEPLNVCERVDAPRFDDHAERLPLTTRASSADPPLTYSLNAAIQAAESDADLTRLSSFLEDHPDAYLASWSWAQNRRNRQDAPPSWTLGYTAPSFQGTLDVTCVFRVAPLQSPSLEPQSDCSVASAPHGDQVGARHDWPTMSLVQYDPWLAYFASTYGHRPEQVQYVIGADQNVTGTIRWNEESDEESAAPDAGASLLSRTIFYDARSGVANGFVSPEGLPFCSEQPCDL